MDNMECGLIEIAGKVIPAPKSDVFFCADFVESSTAGDNLIPVLRKLKFTLMKDKSGGCRKIFTPVLWMPVIRSPLSEIRLYITDSVGDIIPFDVCHLNCTLGLDTPKQRI